jgi:hypothetical protein
MLPEQVIELLGETIRARALEGINREEVTYRSILEINDIKPLSLNGAWARFLRFGVPKLATLDFSIITKALEPAQELANGGYKSYLLDYLSTPLDVNFDIALMLPPVMLWRKWLDKAISHAGTIFLVLPSICLEDCPKALRDRLNRGKIATIPEGTLSEYGYLYSGECLFTRINCKPGKKVLLSIPFPPLESEKRYIPLTKKEKLDPTRFGYERQYIPGFTPGDLDLLNPETEPKESVEHEQA